MRYLCMHKVSPADEAGAPASPELIQGMGELIGEMARTGKFLAGEGLRPSALRFRLTRDGDGWKTARGPLVGRNELPAGLAIVQVASTEEGLAWARRLGDALEAEQLEVGPLTEEWHLGLCPEPEDAPLRLMILHMATADTESGKSPTVRQRAAFAALTAEMSAAGVLAFCESLGPSSDAVRARYRNGDRTVTDGPFAESKELIGGFCLMRMGSLEEVLAFTDRFVDVLGGTREVDVRRVAEADPER